MAYGCYSVKKLKIIKLFGIMRRALCSKCFEFYTQAVSGCLSAVPVFRLYWAPPDHRSENHVHIQNHLQL